MFEPVATSLFRNLCSSPDGDNEEILKTVVDVQILYTSYFKSGCRFQHCNLLPVCLSSNLYFPINGGHLIMSRQFNHCCIQYSRWLFIILSVLLMVRPVTAEEYGRYRATVMHEGGRSGQFGSLMPKVFIIDSKEGHMWTLEQKTKIKDLEGNFALGTVLTYQGHVRPGSKMGEVVEQGISR